MFPPVFLTLFFVASFFFSPFILVILQCFLKNYAQMLVDFCKIGVQE